MLKSVREKLRESIKKIPYKDGVLAVGLFGSMTRDDFKPTSDIDIFVILKKDIDIVKQEAEYYRYFHHFLWEEGFNRDVTVLTYTPIALKKVPTWHTLLMCKEAVFIYDIGNIKELMSRIIKEAKKHNIVYDKKWHTFKIKDPWKHRRVQFELEE